MFLERWRYIVRIRLRSLFRSRQSDSDLDEELRAHIEMEIERRIAAGATPAAARTDTLKSLGGLQQRKEECRDTRGFGLIEEALRNVRFSFQLLRRSPGFAIAAIGLSALGIGVSTAMFTVVHGVLLQRVPLPEPDRLVVLSAVPADIGISNVLGLSEPHFLNVRDANRSFDGVAAIRWINPTVTGLGEPTQIYAAAATTAIFDVLSVRAAIGRGFQASDAEGSRVVVLSDAFWRKYYSASPGVIGASITLDGAPWEIVGVMPSDLERFQSADMWVPTVVRVDPANYGFMTVVGRLKRNVARQQARAELDVLTSVESLPLSAEDLEDAKGMSWNRQVLPIEDQLIGDSRRVLAMFSGAVAFVLLIACANVANLLIAKASTRSREIAIRAALGATRWQIVRQLLTESLVLSSLGGIAGIALAYVIVRVVTMSELHLPRMNEVRLGVPVLLFTAGLSTLSGLAFGVLPALSASRRDTAPMAPWRTAATRRERTRAFLTITEVALSLVLLAGAGVLTRSFVKLRHVDPGFQADRVLAMSVTLSNASYGDAVRVRAFEDAVLERLRAVPSVADAAFVNYLPITPNWFTSSLTIPERTLPSSYEPGVIAVSPGYFSTMGIPFRRGQDFSRRRTDQHVAIVSRSLARDLWHSDDVVGKRLSFSDHPGAADWLIVVGVVDDVKQRGLDSPDDPAIYQPSWQVADAHGLSHGHGYANFVVRARPAAESLIPSVRHAVYEIDPNQSISMVMTMSQLIDETTADRRFQVKVTMAFAAMSLALTIVGIYGVLAYAVAQRTHEIGIRVSLGATSGDAVMLVVRQTLTLVGIGTFVGLAGALGINHLLAGFLFEVTPADPATFAIVVPVLLAAALAAAVIPAWRATRVDPTIALRAE